MRLVYATKKTVNFQKKVKISESLNFLQKKSAIPSYTKVQKIKYLNSFANI